MCTLIISINSDYFYRAFNYIRVLVKFSVFTVSGGDGSVSLGTLWL